LTIRVWGEKAGLEWRQEHPDDLSVKYPEGPAEIWRRGSHYVGRGVKKATRLPAGCTEGFLEAFGNIYREAFRAITAEVEGRPQPKDLDFPTIHDGVEGMRFIETALRSASRNSRWVRYPIEPL
jgi:hypothetical protein